MSKLKHHGMVREMLHDMINKFALTQAQIADFCGVSQQAISAMMNGGGAHDSTYSKLVELYNREYPRYCARVQKEVKWLEKNDRRPK